MTSWMTSLFASTQTSRLSPSDGHDSDLHNYGGERGSRGTSHFTEKKKERNEALEEEENARPPYLHVRNSFGANQHGEVNCDGKDANLTLGAVYDRRGYRRDYRRSSHAFNRYRQNPPARRPKHSFKVYLSILVIFDHLSTGRPA